MQDLKLLVTEREAATLIGLSYRTLQRWRWVGRGPRYAKIGAAVRYELAELRRYVKANTRPASAERSARNGTIAALAPTRRGGA
jgi:hypothetical protein